MSESSIEKSIEYWNKENFEKYKEWLEARINLNADTSIFLYEHIENFLKLYEKKLEMNSYIFKEKLFLLSLELKRVEKAKTLIKEIKAEYGFEPKVIRLYSALLEIERQGNIENVLKQYKKLILKNLNDRDSIKQYILSMKYITKKDTINDYIDYWNNYLKNYMDDQDAWNELGDTYLLCNNYNKAFFCFEELLLHNPYNYKILNKLGDIQASLDSLDGCKNAVKFYCRSLNITVNNRAIWGLCFCFDYILNKEKKLDSKFSHVAKIVVVLYNNLYASSSVKVPLNNLFNFTKAIGK